MSENKLGEEVKDLSLEGKPKGDVIKAKGKIEVGDPMDIRPKSLPLVVKVPDSASSAQKEYAKVLNGYAYKNPEKWAEKKGILTKRLESLAGHEVSVNPEKSLSLNKSKISFVFIRDIKGNEHYAGQAEAPGVDA